MAKAKKTTSDETNKPTARKTRTKKTETKPVEEKVSEILEGQGTEQSADEQPKPIGTLFDTINYTNLQDLDKFVQNLNGDQSLYCVVHAAKSAHKRGVFSIEESEVVSRAIRVLTTPPEDKETSVPDPEVHKAN
jgi:hypothetical protein|tara:strand:- start:43 stop:444 length:402 start_codon:yes stop_codon:yes gene_type:complete